MLVCPHCEESLILQRGVVIACQCMNSTQVQRLEKAQRDMWRQKRDQAIQQERKRRQEERRKRVALSKER